jgi:hypothetical protein
MRLAVAAILVAAATLELPLVAWLGLLGTILGAVALYRAGSVTAWKETASGRLGRIEDLERELAELRTELAIPERIEGIVKILAETAQHQNDEAERRAERGLGRLEQRWEAHDAAAERRAMRVVEAIAAGRSAAAEEET